MIPTNEKYWPLPAGLSQTPNRVIVLAMPEYITALHIEHKPVLFACEYLESKERSIHILVSPNGEIIRCVDDRRAAIFSTDFDNNSLYIGFLTPGFSENRSAFEDYIRANPPSSSQFHAGLFQVRQWVKEWNIIQFDRFLDLFPCSCNPGQAFPWEAFLVNARQW